MTGFTDLIDFTRASSGTYIDPAGVRQTAGPDQPRFDHDRVTGAARGLLIENAATNLVRHSRDLSEPVWSGTATVSNSTGGAWRVENSAGDPGSVQQNISVADDTSVYCFSVDLQKDPSAQTEAIFRPALVGGTSQITGVADFKMHPATGAFDVGAGLIDGGVIDAGDWWRIWCTIQNNGSGNTLIRPVITPSYTGGAITIDYPQVELGAYPTSPIVTGAAAVTRAADLATVPLDRFGYNPAAGTLLLDAIVADPDAVQYFTTIAVGTPDNRLYELRNGLGQITAVTSVCGSQTTFTILPEGSIARGDRLRAAIALGGGTMTASANGGAPVSAAIPASLPAVTTLHIGSNFTGNVGANGLYRSLMYIPRRLSAAEIMALTASDGAP